jgi:MFS family permease
VLIAYALYDLVELAIWVAIVLYAFAEGGVGLTSLVAVVQLVPAALLSPVLVGAAERLPRGVALALGHGAVATATLLTAVALLSSAPVPVVVFGSALATIALATVRPLHYAALPRLARSPEELVSANALSSMAEGFAYFAGPILAGIGVEVSGAGLVFVIATVAGIAATLLCLELGLGRTSSSQESGDEGWRAALGGVVALRRQGAAVVLLLVLTTHFILGGAVDVLGVSFASSVLDISETGAGLVIGAIGIGGLVGGVLAGSLALGSRLSGVIAGSGTAQGLAFAAVALTGLLAPTVVALAVCGLAGAIMLVAGRTLLQRTTDDAVLARVFAVQEAIALLGVALGAALAPILVRQWGAAHAFVPLGLAVAIVVLAGFPFIRRLDARAVLRPAEIALLRRVGFLAALPPYELERLARNATWLDVVAGTEVIRQGETGELFYVIDSGELQVVVDGEARPGLLGPGEAFGELALLRSAPRNATIAAVTDARLLVVAAEDFLAAVTGGVSGHALADEVARAHDERDRRHRG